MLELADGNVKLYAGDCLEVLKKIPENSIDGVVTDPPYHLTSIVKRFGAEGAAPAQFSKDGRYKRLSGGFMNQQWDGGDIAFRPETWAAVYRVMKPGAHLLAFGGTRTYHRMACAIEDAGFEIRDQIQWVYGSGFAKSHNVSKGIDNAAGAERRVVGLRTDGRGASPQKIENHDHGDTGIGHADGSKQIYYETVSATDAAREWEGWGTALKPGHEDLILARKPIALNTLVSILVQKIIGAICQLPSFVKDVEKNSLFSQSVFGEGFGFVQWNAVQKCNTLDDLFALMGTLQFVLEIPSSLNIALSWLNVLDVISKHGNTFTTEMKSSLITDLKTLNFLLSQNTPDIIIKAAIQTSGIGSSASLVENIFNVVAARLKIIQECFALANVSNLDVTSSPVVEDLIEPACEPIVLARKPLSEKTVAANVLKWGTGALNIDGCRVETERAEQEMMRARSGGVMGAKIENDIYESGWRRQPAGHPVGRWPANIITDGSEEVVSCFPQSNGAAAPVKGTEESETGQNGIYGRYRRVASTPLRNDSGSAARFFYTAKASRKERAGSKHPTVKPISLMRYLVRLITPPGGTVLDLFAGTGTTGQAALEEGFKAVLIERETQYLEDIKRRIQIWEDEQPATLDEVLA